MNSEHFEILKEVLIEHSEQHATKGTLKPRTTQIAVHHGMANVVTGVRRSGKTSHIQLLIQQMKPKHYASIDFSDDRLHFLNAQNIGKILEAFVQIKGKTIAEIGEVVWFFDEIQTITGWEKFINRLISNRKNLVFVTGSSSKMLSRDIATVLRGRSLTTEVFPLSFAEVCAWRGLTTKASQITTEKRALLEKQFRVMLDEGGFPEVVQAPKKLHRNILQNCFHTILYRDIVERHNPSNPNLVRYIIQQLMNQVAQPYTINKLTERTKAAGYSLQKQLVQDVISWLSDAYLLFSVPLLSNSLHKQNTNPKKLYCIDNGLVEAVNAAFSSQRGAMLENFVFGCLRHRFEKIFYFKDAHDYETDFVAVHGENKQPIIAIQVCESLADKATRHREVRALQSTMKELLLTNGFIITLSESETINANGSTITVIPAWKWALEWESGKNEDLLATHIFPAIT